jgi:hypothetical protein
VDDSASIYWRDSLSPKRRGQLDITQVIISAVHDQQQAKALLDSILDPRLRDLTIYLLVSGAKKRFDISALNLEHSP